MKHSLMLFLIIFLIIFSSCSRNCEDKNSPESLNSCGSQNLNIDQLSRFSDIYYINSNIAPAYCYRWLWSGYNDTIEVAGSLRKFGRPDYSMHLFFKKNGKCIDYLTARRVDFDDNFVVDINGNPISGGYSWINYNNFNFKLQKFKENELLIGKVNDMTFWIDFSSDTHQVTPYEYEAFYHD